METQAELKTTSTELVQVRHWVLNNVEQEAQEDAQEAVVLATQELGAELNKSINQI